MPSCKPAGIRCAWMTIKVKERPEPESRRGCAITPGRRSQDYRQHVDLL